MIAPKSWRLPSALVLWAGCVGCSHNVDTEQARGGGADGALHRRLSLTDDVLGSGANISEFQLQFTTCTLVKGDDEQYYQSSVDGSGYPRQSYLHFHSCRKTKIKSGGGYFSHFWTSSACRSVSHVIRMDDYFRATENCIQDFCYECTGACATEDDCDEKCLEQCENYYNITGGYDEYYGCSGPYDATDGNAYYYGPICSSKGGVTTAYFLDESCEVRAETSDIEFNNTVPLFNAFQFMNSTCNTCSEGDTCANLYDFSYHCSDMTNAAVAVGEEIDGQSDEEHANEKCYETSTAKWRSEYRAQSKGEKEARQQYVLNALLIIGIVVMLAGMVWFVVISHTYYVRHSATFGEESLCSRSYGESFEDPRAGGHRTGQLA
ncbi:hypothetical protein ACHAXT_003876 [Thalassiosira profunda]